MLTINLPRFGEGVSEKYDYLLLYGWIFELWGCSIDADWLAQYLDTTLYRSDPVPQTFPLAVPYGWNLERCTDKFTRYGTRSEVEYWVVDEHRRRRITVEVYRQRLASGPVVGRVLRLRQRFEVIGEENYRNADSHHPVVMAMLVEGDITTVAQRTHAPPPVDNDDAGGKLWQEREQADQATRQQLLSEAVRELKLEAAALTPFWEDPVTSWFSPGNNPFIGVQSYLTTTSALLHRWLKLMPQNMIEAYLLRRGLPLKGPSLFERVEEQRRLLCHSLRK